MISAKVMEPIQADEFCRLRTGTLELVKVGPGDEPVFIATRDLKPGDEVWLIPLDGTLVQHGVRVNVRGSGTGGNTNIIPSSQGGS